MLYYCCKENQFKIHISNIWQNNYNETKIRHGNINGWHKIMSIVCLCSDFPTYATIKTIWYFMLPAGGMACYQYAW